MITDDNKALIEYMLKECRDGELYDVIIYSKQQFENLADLKMRYLSISNNDSMNITLKYPEDLVSLSSARVKITNMNQCVNLRNLYSWENTYTKEDISSLRALKRLYSAIDKYQGNYSLLSDLFLGNKLEYVYINNN